MDFYKKLHSSDLKPNNDDIHELLNIIIHPHLTQGQAQQQGPEPDGVPAECYKHF